MTDERRDNGQLVTAENKGIHVYMLCNYPVFSDTKARANSEIIEEQSDPVLQFANSYQNSSVCIFLTHYFYCILLHVNTISVIKHFFVCSLYFEYMVNQRSS